MTAAIAVIVEPLSHSLATKMNKVQKVLDDVIIIIC